MIKDVLKELVPINLISLMVVVGLQYYRSALRQPAAITDALGDSIIGLPAFHPFWLLPTAAGIVYIGMTIFQFLHPRLFLPKILVIFVLANLHAALLYHDIGSLDSVLLGMVPSAIAGTLYLAAVVLRKVNNAPKDGARDGNSRHDQS